MYIIIILILIIMILLLLNNNNTITINKKYKEGESFVNYINDDELTDIHYSDDSELNNK